MKKYFHRKLVRDRIPEIIEAAGDSSRASILGVREYKKLLRKKLVEEAKELTTVKKGEIKKELADVLQLVKSIAESEGLSIGGVEAERRKREKLRGAFKKRIFLIWSNKPAGR